MPEMKKFIHPDLHFVFPVVRKAKSPVSDEYLNEWRRLLTQGAYFGLEEWYAEMGIDDNAQASIYAEESGNILRKLNLKAFESDYKIMLVWLPEKMNPECANKLLKIIEEPYEKRCSSWYPNSRSNCSPPSAPACNACMSPPCPKRKSGANWSGKKG